MKTKKKSSKEKGAELEREFAEYMKNELGYNECIPNEKVKGKTSTNEYEVDIIGKRLSEYGEKLRDFGRYLLALGLIAIILEILDLMSLGEYGLYIIGGLLIIGWILSETGKNRMYEYTWVECKNWSNPISKKEITNLASNSEDYHESEDKEFEFSKLLFVSGSGFIKNALRFAKKHNIECYERKSKNKFKIIESRTIV